jgi:LPPG:FO 2-phospho-L-lactate transferase
VTDMTHTLSRTTDQVLALSGGIGGAKLALGLSRILPPGALTVVANTGDDFEHLNLAISPDLDTVTYALAGVDNPDTGWGRRDETWSFMATLADIGGETWFRLGDRDLALHVERTRRLRSGEALSTITAGIARRFGIASAVLPMTDDRVRTVVQTLDGPLEFQRYFVERQCRPAVTGFTFEGVMRAAPHPAIISALRHPQLRAVVICPSNPYISIDPILALPGMRAALKDTAAPVIAVSPIIAGRAVKGPTAKMMTELGLTVDARTVASHYDDIIDGYVIDTSDSHLTNQFEVPVAVTATLMSSVADREALAKSVLNFANTLRMAPAKRASGERR